MIFKLSLDAIDGYKEKIAKLEKNNKRQSAEFKKLITGLNEELAHQRPKDQRNQPDFNSQRKGTRYQDSTNSRT